MLVVHLNINATNVTKTIQAVSAIFVPQDPSPSAKPSPAFPIPVRINRLAPPLSGYSTSAADYFITGFCFGFPIPFHGPSSSTAAPNLLSAAQHPDVVDRYSARSYWHGRLLASLVMFHFQICECHLLDWYLRKHLVNFVVFSIYHTLMELPSMMGSLLNTLLLLTLVLMMPLG